MSYTQGIVDIDLLETSINSDLNDFFHSASRHSSREELEAIFHQLKGYLVCLVRLKHISLASQVDLLIRFDKRFLKV
ncbi:hypothetical protein I2F17_12220 [Acinetobacter sp. B10A]|uniref:hypothetical protein n=1 Tax=Acinetobacter baretiae TaxID=2605383 RepID=UPI001B3C5FCF|nr:hypothetical protein [Acinetobacter baretiae]MBF7686583.1 hypothetical protein [Acinetobacter baretiae]